MIAGSSTVQVNLHKKRSQNNSTSANDHTKKALPSPVIADR
jgi:hypothetical protein